MEIRGRFYSCLKDSVKQFIFRGQNSPHISEVFSTLQLVNIGIAMLVQTSGVLVQQWAAHDGFDGYPQHNGTVFHLRMELVSK